MREWRLSKETIGGFRAVENIHNMNERTPDPAAYEVCLPCSHGEVFEHSPGNWCAIVITPFKANLIASRLGKDHFYVPGEEALFRFPQIDLKWVLGVLEVSPDDGVRVLQAEQFGRR